MPDRDLAQQLTEHRAADAAESAHLVRMRQLLHSPQPFSRSQFAPGHFTASAFVLSPHRDALLLILHRKLGLWLQPGGHVEPADVDLLSAARREVHEEVGLDALELAWDGIFDVDIHRIPAHGAEPAHEHFDVRFLFRAARRELEQSNEVRAARWVPLREVGLAHSDESVLRAVRKLSSVRGAVSE